MVSVPKYLDKCVGWRVPSLSSDTLAGNDRRHGVGHILAPLSHECFNPMSCQCRITYAGGSARPLVYKMEEVGEVKRTSDLGTFFVAFMLLTNSIFNSLDTVTYYRK